MAEHDEGQDKGFVVKDRRRFTSEGELKPNAPPDPPPRRDPPPATPPPQKPGQPAAKAGGPDRGSQRSAERGPERNAAPGAPPQPGMDFLSFVASLATNAMAALGLLPPEQTRGMPTDPELGREYIEILSMLQEKTRGNLTAQEESALQRILTELRMAFVDRTRR
jgi:hypothetical protein